MSPWRAEVHDEVEGEQRVLLVGGIRDLLAASRRLERALLSHAVERAHHDVGMVLGDDDLGGVLAGPRDHLDIEVWYVLGQRNLAGTGSGEQLARAREVALPHRFEHLERARRIAADGASSAAASMPCMPPELGTVTLLTFLMMLPEQATRRRSGSAPSVSRARAAAYATAMGSVQPSAHTSSRLRMSQAAGRVRLR